MKKNIARKILQRLLKSLAVTTLKRYRPKLVGITGSVGKTSTKEAVYLVLNQKYSVRQSLGSYNNEIGIPLTVLGEETAGRSVFGWLMLFIRAVGKIIYCRYPQIVILEMGIDRPGDMDYLLSFLKLDVGILTKISALPVHLENFSSSEELAKEKVKLINSLGKNQWAIINADDPIVNEYCFYDKNQSLLFGMSEEANVRASNIVLNSEFTKQKNGLGGISFKVESKKSVVPILMPYVIARHQVYAALAAIASGIALDMNLVDISQALSELRSAPGRMNLLGGIKNSYIIDDSYNASPDSVEAALKVLDELEVQGRKIAVLGDMKELGKNKEKGHRQVGKIVGEIADILVTVGGSAKMIADEARKAGLDNIFPFSEAEKAGKFIQNKILQEEDLLLIKGSQAMRMEKIVKELMAEPLRAGELLARQEEHWQR